MGFLKIPQDFFVGILKIPMGMPTLADIFFSTVKDFIMRSYRNYSEGSIVVCLSGFKKFGAEKRY